jgi:hypothetical protein
VTAPEITGFIDGTNAKAVYHYKMLAGPGEVTFKLRLDAARDNSLLMVKFAASDSNYRSIFSEWVNASNGEVAGNAATIVLSKKQPILFQITIEDHGGKGGKYQVLLAGPIDYGSGAKQLATAPGKGKLRIEMLDGSTQEIDLARVKRLVWEPAN